MIGDSAALPPDVRKGSAFPISLFILGGYASSPNDAININHQGLIFKRKTFPNSNTRPAIIFRALNQSSSHWVLMNVVHFLHEHILAEDRQRVGVMFPKRIRMSPRTRFASKLLK